MDFSLRCAYAHGTSAIRTHLDSIGKQIDISWEVFEEVRANWLSRMELQATGLFGIEQAEDANHLKHLGAVIRRIGGQLGPCPICCPTSPISLISASARRWRMASISISMSMRARTPARKAGGDCRCSAEAPLPGQDPCRPLLFAHRQPEEMQKRVIGKLAEARIAVVSLPMCNLYLQDRRQPAKPRGIAA